MTDAELIALHGGPTKLAKLLGFPDEGAAQRVQNWKKRGIPPAVKVKHPSLFLNLPESSTDGRAQQAQGVAHA
ncbi:hypothetical protein PMI14_05836 [Acidovorax sp. CF316]|uniref:hypothetical protein n=1 Tax=Acidovorax sp. CF316 TaxID=1144317 RepID=UPI00026BC7FC|nr:hypothetical protein [Acidovorax sp. CF316]EJE49593.1 hypothetical protein PMI14_05836 [Acidovorax sp. CF316]